MVLEKPVCFVTDYRSFKREREEPQISAQYREES